MLSLDHYVRRRGVAEIHRIWRKRPRFLAVVSLRVLIEIMCSTSKARHRALRRKNEDVARSSTPLGSRGDVARERSSRLRVS